jgi:heptaprenyl diphosphate synthase
VSLSIFAAFAHIAGQLIVVRLWLIPHAGVAYLIPIFAAAALVFGVVNGLIAAALLDNKLLDTKSMKQTAKLISRL